MFAFTLAEVLITLVIIGVIAAITVPTLITKYQKEQTVTRLKKAYSALAQTTARAISDNGPINTWIIGDIKTFLNRYITPYMSVIKQATTQEEGNWNNEYSFLNGSKHTFSNNVARFYLNDGTSVTAYVRSDGTDKLVYIYVDINGDKKPNKYGKDIFRFCYFINYSADTQFNGKFLPLGATASREYITGSSSNSCSKGHEGYWCAALIMKDGWQISDDYPW